jgi:hypothetical protein
MGFISQLFGAKSGREKRQDQTFTTNFDSTLAQQKLLSGELGTSGKADFATSEQGLGDLTTFFKKLFSGDRQAITDQYQPVVSDSQERYQKAYSDTATFGGRGGRAPTLFGQLGAANTGEINNLVYGGRKEGAAQLEQIYSFLAQLGLGKYNAATGTGGNLLNTLLGYRQQNENEYTRRQQQIQDTMSSFGKLLAGFG